MGQIDIKAKEYMQRPEVFADLFNYLLYDGQPVLKANHLSSLDPTEIGLPTDKVGNAEAVQKFRDVLKSAIMMEDDNAAYLMILGIENQMNIHYAMPVRNMMYDALNYGHQVTEIGKQNRRMAVKGSCSEFLSGFGKKDHLVPVITLVVYFGQDEWDGPLSIHEMFSKCSDGILKYVPEYRINLISPAAMSDDEINKFKSEFRQLATMIQCGRDKQKWVENVEESEIFRHVDPLTADLGCSITNVNFKLKLNEKGEVDMCRAVQEIREEERMEGRAEGLMEGRAEGLMEGRAEGLMEGRTKGEDRAMALIQMLFMAGRIEDAKRAASDSLYKEMLMKEFAIE